MLKKYLYKIGASVCSRIVPAKGTMRHKFMRITLCLILIALCRPADAAGPGTTAANFLRIGAGARAAGMGEAYTAIADEVNAIYWNPAGMSLMKTKEASFMHAVWLEGINYQHFAYGHPVAKLGTFGIALDYLSMSPIDRTGIDTTGGLDAPVSTGETYSPADAAFTIGYAKKINRISGGVNIKLINSRIDDETATAFAADFGGIYNFGKTLTLGLAIKNAGTQIKYRETSHPLPTDIKFGVGWKPLKDILTVALDINKPLDNVAGVSAGLEYNYWFATDIRLVPRIGYKTGVEGLGETAGMSAGLGFVWSGFILDYAWTPFGQLNDTHRVSISLKQ